MSREIWVMMTAMILAVGVMLLFAGPVGRFQLVPLGPGPVHREQRRGLGQPVDLDELPAKFGQHALDRA